MSVRNPYRAPVLTLRRRRSHVAGPFGINWLHATERGGAVLKGQTGLRTICGFALRVPTHYVHVHFRRRELKP